MIATLLLVLLGILGASQFLIARRPDTQAWIARITPYEDWIGAAAAAWGVLQVATAVFHLGYGLAHLAVHLATGLVAAGLGLVLGLGVLRTFLHDARWLTRLDHAADALAPYRAPLGAAALALAVVRLVV
jgi:hypothetical protein